MNTLISITVAVLMLLVVYRWLRYVSTPLLRSIGIYVYHAQMLFTVQLDTRRYEIHMGTMWDFVRVRDRTQRMLLLDLVRGLIGIADASRNGTMAAEAVVSGFMHFLRPETCRRFGFHVRRPRVLEMIGFAFSYAETCILLSIVKRRLTLIDPRNAWIIETTARQIAVAYPELCKLRDMLAYGRLSVKPIVHAAESTPPKQHYLRVNIDV